MIVAISRWFMVNARASILIFLLAFVWGIWSRIVIPVSAEPEVTVPFMSTSIIMQGTSGEDMVSLVTRPLEDEMLDLEGLVQLSSYSRLGVSVLVTEFDPDFDVDTARLNIERAIDDARQFLPQSIEEPIVEQYTTSDFPLMYISVSGPLTQRALYEVARKVQEALEKLPEVSEAPLAGVPEEVLFIELDRVKMENYDISPSAVYQTVSSSNTIIPLGKQSQTSGAFSVSINNLLKEYEDLASLPVKRVGEKVLLLSDIANIKSTYRTQEIYSRINGQDAISLEVTKDLAANDIDTAESVTKLIEELQPLLPVGAEVYVAQDNSAWAISMVSELTGNILTAVVIVMTLIVALLGFRSGLLIGLSVPFCFLVGFGALNAFGYAFNFMVMFGLLLSMGMLIDTSVVILEFAQRGKSNGLTSFNAYMLAIRRMHKPILASVGTTVLAFVPLMVWPGVTGHFMRYLPVTVFSVLTASLIYGLFFIPVLGVLFDKFGKGSSASRNEQAVPEDQAEVLEELIDIDLDQKTSGVLGAYTSIVRYSVNNSIFIVSAIFVSSLIVLSLFGSIGPGFSYFTDTTPKFVNVNVRSLGNRSPFEQLTILQEVEEKIIDIPGIKLAYLSSGGRGFGSNNAADQIGRIFIELEDKVQGVYEPQSTVDAMSELVKDIPGVIVDVKVQQDGPPIGSDLQVDLVSSSYEDALAEGVRLRDYLLSRSDLTGVTTSLPVTSIEWNVDIDKDKAQALGVDLGTLGAMVSMATEGMLLTTYRPDHSDEEVDVLARFLEEQQNVKALKGLNIPTQEGLVPISSFVQINPLASPGTIGRKNGGFHVAVGTDLKPGTGKTADQVSKEIEQWLKQNPLLPGVALSYAGAVEELGKTLQFLLITTIVVMVSMFILIVSVFNSYYQAFVTLSAVGLSFVGVFLMLLLTNQSLSVVLGGMGLVTLAGVVVNNNIVLVDTYNYIRKNHPELGPKKWALLTGIMRFRPIMLTTATTILGLLPLAFSISIDLINRGLAQNSNVAVYWAGLASTLVSGLSLSGLLTLIFTPASLVLPSALKAWLSERKNSVKKKPSVEVQSSLEDEKSKEDASFNLV